LPKLWKEKEEDCREKQACDDTSILKTCPDVASALMMKLFPSLILHFSVQ